MVWSKGDKDRYNAERKGLGVYKYNWVSKRGYKYAIKDPKFIKLNAQKEFNDLVAISNEFFNWLKDMYRFTNGETEYYIFDPKSNKYIGKELKTQLKDKPSYVLSKHWIELELNRTNSPTIAQFLEDNAQFFDILDEWRRSVKEKHVELMRHYHLYSMSKLMRREEDLEVPDEEEFCL